MPDRQQLEALLVEHLIVVDRICGTLARHHGLRGAEAEDFAAWVRLRLVEDDYRVLARFRGESSLPTYLTVVLSMLARDYTVRERGRWRPSAAALHEGPLAVRLERLVHRDGYSLEQAAERLRASGETDRSTRQLGELLRRLPRRAPLRPRAAEPAALESAPAPGDAEDRVRATEAEAEHARVEGALTRALAQLSAEDRVVVRMRFWEGSSVADIARALGIPQKPLYRRLERALITLRRALEATGIGPPTVRELLEGDGTMESAPHHERAPPLELRDWLDATSGAASGVLRSDSAHVRPSTQEGLPNPSPLPPPP